MTNYKLTIETDDIDDIKKYTVSEDWPLAMFQILADMRRGYKYDDMAWLEEFTDSGITDQDAADMCFLIAQHIRNVMTEYGVSSD